MDFCVTLLFLLLISIHCRLASCWLWLTDWSTHLRFRFLSSPRHSFISSIACAMFHCPKLSTNLMKARFLRAQNTRQTDLIGWKPFATRNSYLICSFCTEFQRNNYPGFKCRCNFNCDVIKRHEAEFNHMMYGLYKIWVAAWPRFGSITFLSTRSPKLKAENFLSEVKIVG